MATNLNLSPRPVLKADKLDEQTTKVLDGIIDRKTASHGDGNPAKDAPVVNVTIDTEAIASILKEQQATAQAGISETFKDELTKLNERIDQIAAAPRSVETPDDLDKTDSKPSNVYVAASNRPRDSKTAIRDFEEIFEKATAIEFDGGRDCNRMVARDNRMLDRFVAQNRPALQAAMQDLGYQHGLFRAAATTLNDIPASFTGYLSSIMRQTPKWGKVWHQFLNPVIRLGTGVGNKIDVPRMGKINRPISSTNWVLTGNGFATTSQNLSNGFERVEIGRYGMGEPTQGNDPVGVEEYLFRHSIIDLESQIQDVLGDNLNEFREIITYEQYAGTSIVNYFKDSTKTIETLATALSASDDARLSYESLVRLRAHMNGDIGVIPWPDGCYVLVAHPMAVVDLEIELNQMAKPISRMDIEEVTNMISMVNTSLTDRISGYRFTVGGFHIFTHENLPPDPNFMKSSTGAGATLRNWYDNIAFGPMAVCEAISMAPEIRRDEIQQFGTQQRYIWLMYGKYQAIERGTASTGSGLGQRSQVVKFRTGR